MVPSGPGCGKLTVHGSGDVTLQIIATLNDDSMLLMRANDGVEAVGAVCDMIAELLHGGPIAQLVIMVRDGHPVATTAGDVVAGTLLEVVGSIVGDAEVNDLALFQISRIEIRDAEVNDPRSWHGGAALNEAWSRVDNGEQKANGDGDLGEVHCERR